ncbi:P-loop containing nucleoside triphosphate hydrolase protein [Dactylonectria estremocensis]|uniref:P-loop containing nucleoside triphosphate hydrolase protein n=1 Tax=Dactylonectria estremocensis TaxID=1079267 RepID=A0A9P9EAT1_9HYPO|nr:P-loop containing nucleoside triphosphate hydrolase protein [Dactylonectria estremocensis]
MAAGDDIDMWRTRVPSRLDRKDPFEGDGFESRPATRLTFHEPEAPVHRPSTRLSFLRSATPLFRRSSSRSQRPPSPFVSHQPMPEKKARAVPPPSPIPLLQYHMNFLFVGAHGSGQTSLLFRARYGYFPDDTSGTPDLNTVKRCAFMKFDAIFLCFDISDKVSLYTIEQWWQHTSSNGFSPQGGFDPPVFLLGLKKDLRDQCFLEDHRNERNRNVPAVSANPSCCVCAGEAMFHADRLGDVKYLECSAATGEGMEEVLNEADRKERFQRMRKASTGLGRLLSSIRSKRVAEV